LNCRCQNSRIDKGAGKTYPAPAGAKNVRRFLIYRFDPDAPGRPRVDTTSSNGSCGPMVLDALLKIKNENRYHAGIAAFLPRGHLRLVCHEHQWSQHSCLHQSLQ